MRVSARPSRDREFLETLAREINTRALSNKLRSINDRISIFRSLDFEIDLRPESTCAQHVAILQRISERDVEGARRAMRVTVEEGCKNVETVVKEALAKAHDLAWGGADEV